MIESGSQLGAYAIVGPLGAGGMGEVYRATDTKLDREVAIKVLPDSMAQDPERVARFEREAKVLASLNHPMIAAIYGFEEAKAKRFLVLELVEGPTLADRLAGGQLTLKESLGIGRQIAEALEVAHEKGIIHRDLKPANVKVTPEGQVKVLDFGLAKETVKEDPSGDSPTISNDLTRAGTVLGTAAYMSPEQIRGKEVDKRTDVWAFGCCLFEMLTGRRPFGGDTFSDLMAAVLTRHPNWSLMPQETPPALLKLLRRCLQKEPRQRLSSIGDIAIMLEDISSAPTTTVGQPPVVSSRTRRWWFYSAAGVVIVTLVAAMFLQRTWLREEPSLEPTPPQEIRRFPLSVLEGLDRGAMGSSISPVISPDGSKIVYASRGSLWVRDLTGLTARQLPDTKGAFKPFWSPRSDAVGYFRQSELWQVPLMSARPRKIADVPNRNAVAAGATWRGDGQITFCVGAEGGALFQVSELGGKPTPILTLDSEQGEEAFEDLSGLPGDRGVVFVVQRNGGHDDALAIHDDRGKRIIFEMAGENLDQPVFDGASGHILFRRETTQPGIWAVPYSLERKQASGPPVLIVSGGGFPSVSQRGDLVYDTLGGMEFRQLVWVDRRGDVIRTVGDAQPGLHHPVISPDDERIAVTGYEGGNWNIWIYDVSRSSRWRLAPSESDEWLTAWTPSGQLVFSSDRQGEWMCFLADLEKPGAITELFAGMPASVSTDGTLVYVRRAPDGEWATMYVSLLDTAAGPSEAMRIQVEDWSQPAIAPNADLILYESIESGRAEIYIQDFPQGGNRQYVTTTGGRSPVWRRDGSELFFIQENVLMRVLFDTQDGKRLLASPQVVFDGNKLNARLEAGYDVSADGDHFVIVIGAEPTDAADTIIVVQNWAQDLE